MNNRLVMNADPKNKRLIASIVIIVAIALIAFGASALTKDKDEGTAVVPDTTSKSQTKTDDTAQVTATNTASGTYKDGTYVINDNYQSPGGSENIKTTVTLKDGIVTDATVTQNANNAESASHQATFAKSYKSKVIGKAIDTLNISRVSGASLTTSAFNDALEQIRTKAEA